MRSVCRRFSSYFVKQISHVFSLCCFALEAVSLWTTKEFSREEVDEIMQKQLHEKILRIVKCV